MTKNILLLLATAAALSFTACSGDEETRYPEAKSEKVAWKVDVRSQTGESVNTDAADKEDQVDNVILAGSTYVASLTGQSYSAAAGGTNTAVFSVESFLGKKDFFFAANLNTADAERMGISGTERDFNALEFNTKDYLRGQFGNDAKKPIPMSAALRDVESPTNPVSGLTALTKSEVRLERCFARIDITPQAEIGSAYGLAYITPYDFKITGIRIVNVPAKFSVGGPIANYDLKHAANATDYDYLAYDLPVGTPTENFTGLGHRGSPIGIPRPPERQVLLPHRRGQTGHTILRTNPPQHCLQVFFQARREVRRFQPHHAPTQRTRSQLKPPICNEQAFLIRSQSRGCIQR